MRSGIIMCSIKINHYFINKGCHRVDDSGDNDDSDVMAIDDSDDDDSDDNGVFIFLEVVDCLQSYLYIIYILYIDRIISVR